MHNLTFTLFGSDGDYREPDDGEMVYISSPDEYKVRFVMSLGWIAVASADQNSIIIDFWE